MGVPVSVLDRLDHTHLRAAVVGFRDALRAHQARLNRLNVYPVPDGDTGTNMALTLESVVTGPRRGGRGRPRHGRHVQGHLPRLAHGGEGQLGRDPVPGPAGTVPPPRRRRAGRRGRRWRRPWPRPARLPTRRSCGRWRARSLPWCGRRRRRRCRWPRARRPWSTCSTPPSARPGTPWPARPSCSRCSKEAGVVDAGGAGFVLFLDALLHVVDGRPVPEAPRGRAGADDRRRPRRRAATATAAWTVPGTR